MAWHMAWAIFTCLAHMRFLCKIGTREVERWEVRIRFAAGGGGAGVGGGGTVRRVLIGKIGGTMSTWGLGNLPSQSSQSQVGRSLPPCEICCYY